MFMKTISALIFVLLVNEIHSLAIQDDKCYNYCSNGAICQVKDNEPLCYCFPEWDGERCDLPREVPQDYEPINSNIQLKIQSRSGPCDLVPGLCLNGGMCFVNDTATGPKLSCQCTSDFAGLRCDEISGKTFSITKRKSNSYF